MRSVLHLLPVAGLVLATACSSSSSQPAVLGSCVGTPDASCAPSGGGGGGGGGGPSHPDSGTQNDTGSPTGDSGGSCGTAGELLNTLNNQCQPCITASCCGAEQACTGPCLSLVQCSSGSAGNINACESQYPSGVTAYDDFAKCLSMSCATPCPTLPIATAGDI